MADSRSSELHSLIGELAAIRREIVEGYPEIRLEGICGHYRESARNLLHYLALRRKDRRPLQMRLSALGLSSLGRSEAHVLATVDAVLEVLEQLHGEGERVEREPAALDFAQGRQLMREHAEAVLGKPHKGRGVRIMVTMPSEAAASYDLVRELLEAGMDCMRINCAHDDASAWEAMVENLRRAEREVGRECRVVMDLAGPKLRTGPIEPGPKVVRVHPKRDAFGRVVDPARVLLVPEGKTGPLPAGCDFRLPLPGAWLSGLAAGDQIHFTDARGSGRHFDVVALLEQGCLVESASTCYIVPGTELERVRFEEERTRGVVGDLPAKASVIMLREGDRLMLTRNCVPGRPARFDEDGRLVEPATIGCAAPEVLDDVKVGEPVWFDDGKIGGRIEAAGASGVQVRITHARLNGSKLAADKGINFPRSELRLGALTRKDLEDLVFAVRHADVVELSFANTAEDVLLLQRHIEAVGPHRPAIVLKVETRRGFENLPAMLLAAMRWPACGVMIARGDLAVECGYERLAEVQEEILWISEAAHVPVVWATQVLETMAKQGVPSRAEITDAAMGDRAECVMLNKGPYIGRALKVLDDILRRMEQHQSKKCAMMRGLRLADSAKLS